MKSTLQIPENILTRFVESAYFAEEPLTEIDFDCPKNIQVRDRATPRRILKR